MAVAKGTETLGVGINKDLTAELREFALRRGETMREVVEMALRRHMANPPPVASPPPPAPPPPPPPIVPLPPVTAPGAEQKKQPPKKKPKKS